ncbi:DsbA family protein [Bradyrhizobium sp. 190]|uniref:DsbA family protein n=1 Tax=Bradyrhizobium sp. 190 TaxID=2782658 RepID=UPI001FF70584|nr:DsbA family protein [Bradyrhizobium sp. 190]MCK1515020.1 DsbA family protein [Bradyrhizobium sp. 190]
MTSTVILYIDYRSPFSFLVKEEAYTLARDFDVTLIWQPFTIDLQGAYGGEVEERTDRDWRKVRYSYMDARRLGARRDLIIRGTRKIYDPTVAHIGMLLASRTDASVFRCYHDTICERFWRGELDIEDTGAIRGLLVEAGSDGRAFDELIGSGEGVGQCRAIAAEAEERGVFGVPTFLLHETGELFWGTDRVWLLRERLSDKL